MLTNCLRRAPAATSLQRSMAWTLRKASSHCLSHRHDQQEHLLLSIFASLLSTFSSRFTAVSRKEAGTGSDSCTEIKADLEREGEIESIDKQGVEGRGFSAPLHDVLLKCDLSGGTVRVVAVPTLPIQGVSLLLGNDLAGDLVVPALKMSESAIGRIRVIQYFALMLDTTHSVPKCA